MEYGHVEIITRALPAAPLEIGKHLMPGHPRQRALLSFITDETGIDLYGSKTAPHCCHSEPLGGRSRWQPGTVRRRRRRPCGMPRSRRYAPGSSDCQRRAVRARLNHIRACSVSLETEHAPAGHGYPVDIRPLRAAHRRLPKRQRRHAQDARQAGDPDKAARAMGWTKLSSGQTTAQSFIQLGAGVDGAMKPRASKVIGAAVCQPAINPLTI